MENKPIIKYGKPLGKDYYPTNGGELYVKIRGQEMKKMCFDYVDCLKTIENIILKERIYLNDIVSEYERLKTSLNGK